MPRREEDASMLSVPAVLAPPAPPPAAVVAAVNMRYCLHGMHDNTLLRLADKGRKVKARVSDRSHLPAAPCAAYTLLWLEIYVSATPSRVRSLERNCLHSVCIKYSSCLSLGY